MNKYLYIFNYPPEEKELCFLEFKYLFNDTYQSKYYFTNTDIDIHTSIFIKAKIDIYKISNNFNELTEHIKNHKLYYLDFKVIYLKNEITHIDYQESLDRCKDLSWGIEGSVNMSKPQNIIALTKIEDNWICGYYHHGTPSWQKHDDKPNTFSNSLDIRLARTLINIAAENNKELTIVDPCCGVGTVVLEGLALNLSIEGYDISREISWQARLNLLHFGYDKEIVKKSSIQELNKHFDVAIIDMPYNLYTPITYEEQCDLINAARNICDKLVIVTIDDMVKEIINANFSIIDYCVVRKSNFKRKIYVCR